MNQPDILAALDPVAAALEALGIPYYVGGSIASSVHGIARATADVDLIVALRAEHIQPLVARLQDEYYIDEHALRDALSHHASTNLIHLGTMLKVDIFVVPTYGPAQHVFRRVHPQAIDLDQPARLFPIPSAEDVVLAKLAWYELGNRISDRQWNDILGVLKAHGPAIDRDYLRQQAARTGLSALLERALDDAGSE